ncbi:MAG: PHP-associated domain-containing protein [Solirubrobacterales bacterium]
MPAAIYIETHGGTGIGGSDDHAGGDIGRTFTEATAAATPEEFLQQMMEGRVAAGGEQGSAAK